MRIESEKYSGVCSCGRTHEMETKLSIVESGCLRNLAEYMAMVDLKGITVAVYDENTYKATADRHPETDYEIILNPDNLHANEHGVDLLYEKLPEDADILIAIGSGTIHDITRYCAYKKNVSFVSCPTAASVDGFCSSVAAMTWHGCKKTLTAVAPTIVVADLDIVKKAPLFLAKSGFGDMVGKYIALSDWKMSHIITGEYYCDRIAEMTMQATETVLQSAKGILSEDETAYENLMYGLLLSGLAMQMIGNSRPASGAEHHISHIIEMAPVGLGVSSEALHGEKVGVGTLIAAEEYKKIRDCSDLLFKDYEEFDTGKILDIFGEEMSKEILEENKNDSAAGIKGDVLKEKWQQVCAVLDNIPDVEVLRNMYAELGIKATLADIDVREDAKQQLIECSPMVRNRLSLMRLRSCLVK